MPGARSLPSGTHQVRERHDLWPPLCQVSLTSRGPCGQRLLSEACDTPLALLSETGLRLPPAAAPGPVRQPLQAPSAHGMKAPEDSRPPAGLRVATQVWRASLCQRRSHKNQVWHVFTLAPLLSKRSRRLTDQEARKRHTGPSVPCALLPWPLPATKGVSSQEGPRSACGPRAGFSRPRTRSSTHVQAGVAQVEQHPGARPLRAAHTPAPGVRGQEHLQTLPQPLGEALLGG